MLKFVSNEKEYRLRFQHHNPGREGQTFALLEVMRLGNDPPKERVEEVLIGSARCHPVDQYIKETGRQVALQNLLLRNPISRELRGKILSAYFTRK